MVSNWYLYIGVFLIFLGVTLPLGVIFIVYYFFKYFMDNGIKVRHEDEQPVKSNTSEIQNELDHIEHQITNSQVTTGSKMNYMENSNKEKWT